jgi:hypothetical protein
MIARRRWLLTVIASAFALLPGRRLAAQQGNSVNSAERLGSQNIAPLADQLNKGLRAVTPEQKQFVQVVVAYVEQGQVPRAMVNLVYRWALERNATVPFPYFEYAMRALSKRRGVVLP